MIARTRKSLGRSIRNDNRFAIGGLMPVFLVCRTASALAGKLPVAPICLAIALCFLTGCESPGQRARVLKKSDALLQENRRMQRDLDSRDGEIAALKAQVQALEGFGADRPADLFAPVKIDIASRSGGADYDGKPGDDGVTVYLRPYDADGDVVKTPGRISIQLINNDDLENPVVLGVYKFGEPDELRKLWNSRFSTDHYTLKCPFVDGVETPASRRVTVSVVFVDYLTGKTLTAVKEVSVS